MIDSRQCAMIAGTFGDLKGAAMKVGQMLSTDPELLPDELGAEKKRKLIELASTGAAAVTGPAAAADTRRDPAPGTEAR